MIAEQVPDAEHLLARAAFDKKQPSKEAMLPTQFNTLIREAESAITCFDTDAYDLRQRMEPLLGNQHLNPAQQARVLAMRAKLMKVLIEHGFIDAWGVAVKTDTPEIE